MHTGRERKERHTVTSLTDHFLSDVEDSLPSHTCDLMGEGKRVCPPKRSVQNGRSHCYTRGRCVVRKRDNPGMQRTPEWPPMAKKGARERKGERYPR